MEKVLENFSDGYEYYFDDLVSPVAKDLFMVASPHQIFSVVGVYLLFCMKLGPWFMKDRKPYDLRNVIKLYNVIQIIINFGLFYEGCVYIFFNENFNFYCYGPEDPSSPRARRAAISGWLYFIVKVIDLMDTIFFVLRKSERQITTLHLHHHAIMPIMTWFFVTYYTGGQAAIMATINVFVHAVMYTYYFLSGFGDKYKKYLWWKKYLTVLQLIQFTIVGCHSAISLFYPCSYPTYLKIIKIFYAVVFFNMFAQFYYKTYIKSSAKKKNQTSISNGIDKAASGKVH